METIFTIFFALYTIFILYLGITLFKNLPNTKERLKFVIPLLIAFSIGVYVYLNRICFCNLP